MESKGERKPLSEIEKEYKRLELLAKYQESPVVKQAKAVLQDPRLIKEYENLIYTKEGQADLAFYRSLNLHFDCSKVYYVHGFDEKALFRFMAYYTLNVKDKNGMSPIPSITTLSTFIDYTTLNTLSNEGINNKPFNDGMFYILAIYISRAALYGNKADFYSTQLTAYTDAKRLNKSPVIILGEVVYPEFVNTGHYEVIDLSAKRIITYNRVNTAVVIKPNDGVTGSGGAPSISREIKES